MNKVLFAVTQSEDAKMMGEVEVNMTEKDYFNTHSCVQDTALPDFVSEVMGAGEDMDGCYLIPENMKSAIVAKLDDDDRFEESPELLDFLLGLEA